MVKLIVLDANIGSMTEFKQIIGRGTRIREGDGKVYFTIMDFRKATNLFADPDFDGDPVMIYEPGPDDPILPEEEAYEDTTTGTFGEDERLSESENIYDYEPPEISITGEEEGPKKYYVNNVKVLIAHERVQYYGPDGKLITESLKDYTRKNVHKEFVSIDNFKQKWNQSEKKEDLVKELAEQGILVEALKEEVGHDWDVFDLVCHVAFDQPPLTRKERANNVRKRNYFAKYGDLAQKVISNLIDKYEEEGITSIESGSVLKVKPLSQMGSPVELVRAFGSKKAFDEAIRELEDEIYKTAG